MLYTIAILISGVYIGQEYQILPSVRILMANLFVYLRNLRDPTLLRETAEQAAQNVSIYERIVKIFWW
jgi:hypothetical protein